MQIKFTDWAGTAVIHCHSRNLVPTRPHLHLPAARGADWGMWAAFQASASSVEPDASASPSHSYPHMDRACETGLRTFAGDGTLGTQSRQPGDGGGGVACAFAAAAADTLAPHQDPSPPADMDIASCMASSGDRDAFAVAEIAVPFEGLVGEGPLGREAARR